MKPVSSSFDDIRPELKPTKDLRVPPPANAVVDQTLDVGGERRVAGVAMLVCERRYGVRIESRRGTTTNLE
jgi:hypothetical protein